MDQQAPQRSGSRETRLLVATIAVSLLMLALLARFRFPSQGTAETAEPAPAPLERLAAQASYDELASAMTDLERKVKPSLIPMRAVSGVATAVAVRVTSDRAVAWVPAGDLAAPDGGRPEILGRDPSSGIAILAVPTDASAVVTPRTGIPRAGPRYVAVADAPSGVLALRPTYVGATVVVAEPVTGRSLLSIAAAPQAIAAGAPLFTFAGTFIGIAARVDGVVSVVPADALKGLAEAPPQEAGIHLGIEVQPLTDALARVAGTATGVMVAAIAPGSPAGTALAVGDVIQSFDSTPIATPQDVAVFERTRPAGAHVKVSFVRKGQSATVEIATAAPEPAASAAPGDGAGITLRTSQGRTTVLAVRGGGPAAKAGIERGDVIVSVNGGTGDLVRAYRDLEAGAGLLVAIERDGVRRIVALEKR